MTRDEEPDNFLNADAIEAAERDPAPPAAGNDRTIDFTAPAAQSEKPRHRARKVLTIAILIIAFAAGVAIWLRYFNPYVTDARATGYVTGVEKRGVLFKTFEGQLISADSAGTAPAGVYQRDMAFSVASDSLAQRLQKYQQGHHRVTVGYVEYAATLPWRGASRIVVTSVAPAP